MNNNKRSLSTELSILTVCVILFAIFIAYITAIVVPYHTHQDTVQKNAKQYGYADFDCFKYEFNKYEWTKVKDGSLVADNEKCVILNSNGAIVIFNNVRLIMNNQIEFIKMKVFLNDKFRKINTTTKPLYDWSYK